MTVSSLLLRCLLSTGIFSLASTIHADAIDKYVAATMRRLHIPGASVAILRHGKTLKARSYGFSDLELRTPVTNQSPFMIGSVSKQFESVAILALAQDGRIGLGDLITKYLDGVPAAWQSITIRDLLTHTSGIKDYTTLPEHKLGQAMPVTAKTLIKNLGRYPLEFEPGSKWSYSNTGSYLEGLIIEKVTGTSYEAFARKRLWLRAGMKSTRINRWNDVIPLRVRGYVWQDGAQRHPDFEDDSWPWAGGGCVSSLDDLAAWMMALESGHMISAASLKRLWSPIRLSGVGLYPFGLDWFLSDLRGRPRIFRTGQIGGFSAVIARYPQSDLDVIVLCNEDGIETPRIASGIAGLVDSDLAPVAALPTPSDPDPTVTSNIRQGIGDLASGASNSRWLTPGMIASTTEQRRSLIAASLKAHASLHFISADDLRRRPIDRLGSRVVEIRHYLIRFAGVEVFVGIYRNADGRIAYVLDE